MAEALEVYRFKPSEADIEDLLQQRLTASIGTINPNGSVHLAYVIFLSEAGRLYFETSSITAKAKNVAARPHCSILLQGTTASGRHLMVTAEGTARLIIGQAAHDINHRLREKYIRREALAGVDKVWGRLDDVSVEVTPTRWRSWTGELFQAETQAALDIGYNEMWIED